MEEVTKNADLADRLVRRRARVLPVLGLFILIQQFAYFANANSGGDRLIDHIRRGEWVVMSLMVLAMLTTGGSWFRSAKVRAMIEDESARANRAKALSTGFLCAMLTAIACYVMRGAWEFSVGVVIHLIVSAGLVSALLRFSLLERRDLA